MPCFPTCRLRFCMNYLKRDFCLSWHSCQAQIVRRTRVSTWHELPKDLPSGQAKTRSYSDIRVSSPFCALMRNWSVSWRNLEHPPRPPCLFSLPCSAEYWNTKSTAFFKPTTKDKWSEKMRKVSTTILRILGETKHISPGPTFVLFILSTETVYTRHGARGRTNW